jgi:hypothetical protein
MCSQQCRSTWMTSFITIMICLGLACEIDTVLKIKGGNPPGFVMSGNGIVGALMVTGPKKQREAVGEDASVYWRIRSLPGEAVSVGKIGTIVYGKVPEGYRQIYPETGEAAPLVEGERYYIRVDTSEANGAEKYFILQNGNVKEIEISSGLRR